jgi:hypothetical protein
MRHLASNQANVGATPTRSTKFNGGMAKLQDAPDLGSGSERSAGGNPATATIFPALEKLQDSVVSKTTGASREGGSPSSRTILQPCPKSELQQPAALKPVDLWVEVPPVAPFQVRLACHTNAGWSAKPMLVERRVAGGTPALTANLACS